MKYIKYITRLAAGLTALAFCTTNAFAGLNLGNDDGTGFSSGTDNNYWGVHTDSGNKLYDTEGLRVTVYDAETNSKVFNTIDISGNVNISAVSDIYYFADGSELIPKTTWLSYVSTTYNSANSSDMIRFNEAVTSRNCFGDGYSVQYVEALSSIDIISTNNTSHLAEIKALLSEENFLKNLCDLLGDGMQYDDITQGKYKLAFEPVSYLRYNGLNWALSATECGLLNKYMKNYFSSAWNSTNNLRALLGPLTHSNLPRSAFLENRDLGIPVYSPTTSDYYNGNQNYNSDTCIIRCMGIGVLTAEPAGEELPDGEDTAEYHTNTDVFTSFSVKNIGDSPFVGTSVFSIKNSLDETPKISEELKDEPEVVKISYNSMGPPSFYYAYPSDDLEISHYAEDAKVQVFVDNPRYVPDEDGNYPYGVTPYKLLGYYKDGDEINLGSAYSGRITYSVKNSSGRSIKSGTVSITCPADEEAMGWFEWHTPSKAQSVTITLKSTNDDLVLLDKDGNACETLTISADISKVEEITPPDPTVSDTRPSWQNIYSMSSVQSRISGYVSTEAVQELSWYTWTFGAGWSQNRTTEKKRVKIIVDGPTYDHPDFPYLNAETEKEDITISVWGVDNKYYASERATKESGKFYTGAVYISTENIELEKQTCTVSLSADIKISPSEHCNTAAYNLALDKYTIKSGYGIQIAINAHLSGDTEYCTGSQTANVLFPEFNYNRQSTAKYNRLLEKVGNTFVFKQNKYSSYKDRVHFTPIWYPNGNYTIYAEVFDVWCPAGQLSIRLTDQISIKGNVFDDWHIAPIKP